MTSLHATLRERAFLRAVERYGEKYTAESRQLIRKGIEAALAEYEAWLAEDAQVEAAAQALYEYDHDVAHPAIRAWADLPDVVREPYESRARAALGALTHHEETP